MIYEIAEIDIKPGEETLFEAAVKEAAAQFKKSKGCCSLELHKGIERPATYRLIVGWETVEDHTVTFRNSEEFKEWRRLAGGYFAVPPRVEHVTVVLKAF